MRFFSVRYLFAAAAVVFLAHPNLANAADASQKGADTFHNTCEMCHGATGTGSAMGKSLQVPDLLSDQVQSQTDAELERFIAEGKGAMPAFKDSLSHEQIRDEVHYIRYLKEHYGAHK